jgi:phenylacetate-coenzyme A ligase PaaK-like adenylate-forming protein
MDWEQLINLPVYQLNQAEKMPIFNQKLAELANHHYQNSESYRDIINFLYQGKLPDNEVPPLSARLFKHHLLQSINDEDIFKITTSSGTTSQQVSRIVLDKENILRQQKVLAKIVQQWLGRKRLPMLIIDHPNVIKDKYSYSARGVGIQGLSLFGHHHTYALNDDMTLNILVIEAFFEKYAGEKVFIFGFTFIVWQYFVQALKHKELYFNLTDALLLHSGGWKKLQDKAVSNQAFKVQCQQVLGPKVKVHNFYGMVEQTGTIHVECEAGYLHCPVWSDVVIRSKNDLTREKNGIEGIIQVNSLLPTSYPGHALLTEDLGMIIGEDDCQCGKKGKYFQVNGRLAKAEIRGCSDTQS